MPLYSQASRARRRGLYGTVSPSDAAPVVPTADEDVPVDVPPDVPEEEPTGFASADMLLPALAGGALVGAAALTRNPALVGKGIQQFNNLRKAALLAGYAPLKSGLGNLGAGVVSSLERGSARPIAEIISPKWVGDIVKNFARGGRGAYGTHTAQGAERYYNIPGRFMGAMDEATGAALQRAGLSADEAARELLQGPAANQVVDFVRRGGPVMDYLMPFPRIPTNAALEGFATLNPQNAKQALTLAIMGGGGFLAGANSDGYLTPALVAAASGRYGVPSALGAATGRYMTNGSIRDVVSSLSPFPEAWAVEKSFEPLDAFSRLRKRLGL